MDIDEREKMNYQLQTDPDEMEELTTQGLKVRNAPHQQKDKNLTGRSVTRQVEFSVAANDESRYPFSYHASRYEKEWLMASTKDIYEQMGLRTSSVWLEAAKRPRFIDALPPAPCLNRCSRPRCTVHAAFVI